MGMALAFVPAPVFAPKQPCLVVRIDAAVAHEAAKDVVPARHPKSMDLLRSGRNRLLDFLLELGARHFFGVDLEHPFVPPLQYGPVLLLGLADVLMLHNAN